MSNEEIAEVLERVAELLSAQEANRFRVAAYRKAAATLRELPNKAGDILETSGVDGLATLSAVGLNQDAFVESTPPLHRGGG
jgi:DNA polymerase (family X)